MKAGFGPLPDESVLRRLEAQGGRAPRVRLPEPGATAGAPPVGAPVRYQILGEIARGGVGVVLRGRDSDLGRDIAMKVLRPEYADNKEILERFLEEAQVGGQLQHPGIVPVYEMGLDAQRRAFFTMKLVKGETLAALLRERGSPAADRRRFLTTFEQVCQTIAYAHARGVIHRDLKPSNVMVGAFGEVVVLDWGFAKVLAHGGVADERPRDETVIRTSRAAGGSESQAGSVLGTPAYMPPEQALGQVEAIDTRSDVFSLGAILCEILTGEPPYKGAPTDLLVLAAQGRVEDALARLDGCVVEADLKALAKRCLEPAPGKRPRDASAVAQAVADHLAGVDERARVAELHAAQARVEARSARRARMLTLGLAAAVVATLAVVGGASAWTARDKRDRRERTRTDVAGALTEARTLLGEAESGGAGGPWDKALAAARKARALAAAGYDPGPLALEARAIEARVEASRFEQERERLLRQRLDEGSLAAPVDTPSRKKARAQLAAALAEYGIDVLALGDEEILRLMRASRIPVELAEVFDAWASRIEGVRGPLPDEARRLLRLAKEVDPDPFRCKLRDAVASTDNALLLDLARSPDALGNGPGAADRLAGGLWDAGEHDAAVAFLFAAQRKWPGNFWLNFRLAAALRDLDPPRHAESAQFCAAAVALRPDFVVAKDVLGHALQGCGDISGAIDTFRAALADHPDCLYLNHCIAAAHKARGDLEEAVARWREEALARPGSPVAHLRLGEGLSLLPDREGAVATFREAVRLLPESPYTHHELARALAIASDAEGSIAEYREAVKRDPDESLYRSNLAKALAETGRYDEAAAILEEILLWDSSSHVRINLGDIQRQGGRLAESEATLRKALEKVPNMPRARSILGMTLKDKGDAEGAIDQMREAIRLKPDDWWPLKEAAELLFEQQRYAEAREAMEAAIAIEPHRGYPHYICGRSLLGEGEFEKARERLLAAGDLAVHPSWAGDLDAYIGECDACLALRDSLPAILAGKTGGRDAADLCFNLGYFAKASELYGNGEERLFRAACAAAMAGAGRGRDAPPEPAREALRMAALERLRIALAAEEGRAAGDRATARHAVASWRRDAAFAGMRGQALDGLPPREREWWLVFWRDVDTFLERTRK